MAPRIPAADIKLARGPDSKPALGLLWEKSIKDAKRRAPNPLGRVHPRRRDLKLLRGPPGFEPGLYFVTGPRLAHG